MAVVTKEKDQRYQGEVLDKDGRFASELEAFHGFVRNLSNNLLGTYLVAQHMVPHHKSMLLENIGR